MRNKDEEARQIVSEKSLEIQELKVSTTGVFQVALDSKQAILSKQRSIIDEKNYELQEMAAKVKRLETSLKDK